MNAEHGSSQPVSGRFLPLPLSRLLIASALLLAAAVAVHSGSLNGQFLSWDDEHYVTDNPRIRNGENLIWFFQHPYFNSFTPLAFVSHALDWRLWGSDPRGHHAHSLLLHGLNTVALFWLALFFFGHRWPSMQTPGEHSLLAGAATAALLFAVHPLRVESVAWISDRKDLLAALFALTSTLAYFRGTVNRHSSPSWAWIATSAILFALALLSKFVLVFLPLAILVAETLFLSPGTRHERKWQLVLWKTPFLVPALAIGLLAVNAVGVDPLGLRVRDIPLADRLALPFATPWFYIQKLLVPANLSPVYQVRVSLSTWITVVPFAAITAISIALWRAQRPGVLGAWLSYLLLLSPSFLFLSPFIQHTADRHSYFATMPFFLLAGGGIALLWHRTLGQNRGTTVRLTLATLILIISTWYGYLTIRQTRVWQNSVSLWAQVITVSPDLPIGYQNLATAVAAAGNTEDAISLLRRATALEKGYGPAWTNMGVLYQMQGKSDEAKECFRRSIAFNPEYFEAYLNLGEIEEVNKNPREAERLYRQASVRNPASPKPWIHLGELFRTEGQTDSSLRNFQQALAVDPFAARAHYGVALTLEEKGEHANARRHLEDAARLGYDEAKKQLENHP